MGATYQHFCPVARSLEKIGDKWSLLIVRDLLRGPQRFTDLMGYLNNITPKWLTLRLRALESAGIIQRDSQPGRREVRYELTPAGLDLRPVVETLTDWGMRHAMRPPRPEESVHADLMIRGLTLSLNKKHKKLNRAAAWAIHFPRKTFTLSFDHEVWSSSESEASDPDLRITTTPVAMAHFVTVPRDERRRLAEAMQYAGTPDRIMEFKQVFGIPDDGEKIETCTERKKER
jgi:DNA-binding HxlR family transcriptional regulator